MKEKLSRERIEQYANDPRMCNINAEIRTIARMLLALQHEQEIAEKRIAELESRTVKLPHRNLGTKSYSFFARSLTTMLRIWRRLWPPLASRWRLSDGY